MLCLAWYWWLLVVLGSGTLGAAVGLAVWFWMTQRAAGNGGWHSELRRPRL